MSRNLKLAESWKRRVLVKGSHPLLLFTPYLPPAPKRNTQDTQRLVFYPTFHVLLLYSFVVKSSGEA